MGRFSGFAKYSVLLFGLGYLASLSSCDGKADLLSTGDYLGDPTIEDGGGTRSDGGSGGQIYTVTQIVEATSDIPTWTNSDLPFTGPRLQLGTNQLNSQWPFEFNYTYPANNYALNGAHLLLVTSRDSSDTEAIFFDGVLTGKPPSGFVQGSSPKITNHNYVCPGGCSPMPGTANTFFMDWALTHYKIGQLNTFDMDVANLLTPTAKTPKDLLSDGVVRVVAGDDAFIETNTTTASRPLLILSGSTVSTTPLTCSTSSTYKLINSYLHNDGNSISQAAFSGTVLTPFNSWGSAYAAFRSVEFYYDPRLPQLPSYDLLNITKANLVIQLRRTGTGPTAIVINGIGIDQTGFDRTPATAAVESWSTDPAELAAWNTFVNAIPSDASSQTVTLNLLSLLGAAKVKELLLQGKLNVSLAGPIARVYGQAATSSRTYGVAVNGPDLVLEGNYAAEICEVPDDPGSPLNGGGTVSDCLVDKASPIASSIQVVNITSTSARIQWLTNENSSTQIGYGLTSPSTVTTENTTPTTFHAVDITGLSPYKYYSYNVRSTDSCGNQTISGAKSFRTLR